MLDGVSTAVERAGWRPGAQKVIIVFGDAPPRKEDDGLEKLYALCRRWKESGGRLSCIDTTGGSKVMPEFARMAEEGGGEATFINDERAIARRLAIFVFGTRWEGNMDKVWRQLSSDADAATP